MSKALNFLKNLVGKYFLFCWGFIKKIKKQMASLIIHLAIVFAVVTVILKLMLTNQFCLCL